MVVTMAPLDIVVAEDVMGVELAVLHDLESLGIMEIAALVVVIMASQARLGTLCSAMLMG